MRLRVVRADSGFYVAELLHLWEQLGVKFIVVARLTQPVRSLLRRETCWLPTGLDGTAVAELEYDAPDLPATARFVAIRHRYIATNFLGHGTVNPKANESDD